MTRPASVQRDRDRAERLFDEALSLAPEEQASFIAESCRDDAELEAELLSLLEHAGAGEELLRQLARFDIPDLPAPSFRAGRFEIVGCISVGGMGAVYRAHDTRLDRDVALKFLPPAELSSSANVEDRLLLEARAVAALEHLNICTVHEIGETEDGRPFIAMTLYEGETLKDRLTRGPLSVSEVLEITIQLARGLGAAHAHGVVHRDVKPGNIMLTSDRTVKLLDFGLATSAADSVAAGATPGTVPYMSPEQVRGEAADLKTDLWSLGIVMYEMLTGSRPFSGADYGAVMQAILHSTPEPLHRRAPTVSRSLQRMVAHLLEKETSSRYASADDLLADLTVELVRSRRHALYRRLLGSKRGRVVALFGAVTMVVGAVMWPRAHRPPAAPRSAGVAVSSTKSIAVLPFAALGDQREEEYLSDGLTLELTRVLSRLQGLHVAGRASAFKFKDDQSDIQKVGRALRVSTVLTGTVEYIGDLVRVRARLHDAASGNERWSKTYERNLTDIVALQHDVALDIAASLEAELSAVERARLNRRATVDPEALTLYLKGRYFWNQRTSSGYARASEYFQRAIKVDSLYAPAYAGLAAVYSQQGMAGQLTARAAQAKSRAAALRAVALDENLAEAHAELGAYLHAYQWDSEAAEREFMRAIALDPNLTMAHHYYGNFLRSVGRFPEAIVQNQKAVELDPLVPGLTETLAFTLLRAGRPAGALEQIRSALELDSTYWRAHAVLGNIYEVSGRDADAIRAYQRANQLAGPATHRTTADLARVLAHTGRQGDARALLDTLMSRTRQTGDYEPSVATALYALGDTDAAVEWLEQAYLQKHPHLRFITGDARFLAIEREAQFADLMRRVGVRR